MPELQCLESALLVQDQPKEGDVDTKGGLSRWGKAAVVLKDAKSPEANETNSTSNRKTAAGDVIAAARARLMARKKAKKKSAGVVEL